MLPDLKAEGIKAACEQQVQHLSRDLRSTLIFFSIILFIGLLAVGIHCKTAAGTGTMWALAGFALGGGVGFLFGIPRIQQRDNSDGGVTRPNIEASKVSVVHYRLLVNTNLENVSDWLTKILVGLGIASMNEIKPFIRSLVKLFARSITKQDPKVQDSEAFALAIIIFFPVVGFLFGYLVTRLFLQRAFAKADQAASAIAAEVEKSRLAPSSNGVGKPEHEKHEI